MVRVLEEYKNPALDRMVICTHRKSIAESILIKDVTGKKRYFN